MTTDGAPADPLHPVASADVYRPDGTYMHLEEDWRQGLGWWLVDGHDRRRVSLPEAIRSVPRPVAHEVLVEAQQLAGALDRSRRRAPASDPGLGSALDELRGELVQARTAFRDDRWIVGAHLGDQLSGPGRGG